MTAVGTKIRERTAPVARGADTDTGKLFLVGLSAKGRIDKPVELLSMAGLKARFGDEVSYSSLHTYLTRAFSEGLSRVVFSRVVGPNPVPASVNLLDVNGGHSLTMSTKSPYDASDDRHSIIGGDAAGDFKILIQDLGGETLEESPNFTSQTDAVEWSEYHDDIAITLGATELNPAPVADQAYTTTGTDDRANITDAQWAEALARFPASMGPGQVAAVNRTSNTGHTQLLTHAGENNRVALLDPPDTTSKAALMGASGALRQHEFARHGALFAPWVKYPNRLVAGRLDSVPPSALVAGVIARNDSDGVTPNQPSGGTLGIAREAVDVATTFPSEVDRSDLNEGSVNLIITKNDTVRIYGYRSLAPKAADPNWYQFANVRLYMKIVSLVDNILENYVLKMIDGRNVLFGQLGGEITGMLLDFFTDNSLYGETPEEAFLVITDSSVNTVVTKGNGEIHAAVELVMSPTGETVILDITKKQIAR